MYSQFDIAEQPYTMTETTGPELRLHALLKFEEGKNVDWKIVLKEVKNGQVLDPVDSMGSTVLYKAVKRDAPLEVIQAMVEKAPHLLGNFHMLTGFLPLHEACHPQNQSQDRFIKIRKNTTRHLVAQTILLAYPQASMVVSSGEDQMLPLHAVMQHRPPLDLVKIILEEMVANDPAARSVEELLLLKDADNQTPLQLGLQCYAPTDTIAFLIGQSKRSVYQPGHENFLPLHNAVYFGAPKEVFDTLLGVHHGAIMTKENIIKTSALEVAFHEHTAARWHDAYEEPESGIFPDGCRPDGRIECPPSNALPLDEVIDLLLKSLLRRFNAFTKTRDITKISPKVAIMYHKALTPVIAEAKYCKKHFCSTHPATMLDKVITKLVQEKRRSLIKK